MALYFRSAVSVRSNVFQNDKSIDDSKFFCNYSVRGALTTNGVSAIPSAYVMASFPLNAESVELKGIVINKKIQHIDSTGVITYTDPQYILPVPSVDFTVLVGMGDQENNANVIDVTEFNKQNKIFIPCQLQSTAGYFTLPAIKEKFNLTSNQNFLNIFVLMTIANAGDITNFQTDFNAIYTKLGGALLMGNFLYDLSIFVAGKTTLKKIK